MNSTLEAKSTPLLSAVNVSKHFGGVNALKNAQFTLCPGEVHALMGENGAGKSTFGKILAGVLHADSGALTIAGEPFVPANPQRAQAAGLAMIFQEIDLFPELSVADNMAIGNHACHEGGWVRRQQLDTFCRPFLDQVGLDVPSARKVGDLPIGHQQLVAIARALSMDANILVMDESTSSLTEDAAETLFALIEQLKTQGVAIIYVSHKMDEIFRVCDRVTVLRDGEVVGTEVVADTSMNALIQMMVGRPVDRLLRNPRHATDTALLDVRGLCTAALTDIDFTLHCGEVIGLAGLVGSGRSEVGRAVFGLDRHLGGTVTCEGRPYAPSGPRKAMMHGTAFVPEDRKSMGLMMQMSVKENMTLAGLHHMQRAGFVRASAERSAYQDQQQSTGLKTASPHHPVSSLSGGNQQKTLLGRWLMQNPKILFLDDPTRGVDVGAKEDIYKIIENLAADRKGVLMVSSELPELLRCCDRILVLNQGRLTATLVSDQTSQEEIMHYAATPINQFEASL